MEPEHVGRCVKRSLQFLLPTGEQRRLLTQQMLLFFGGGVCSGPQAAARHFAFTQGPGDIF